MYHIVAIVNLGGTEQYFDPGVKYCKFGQLAWEDTEASGVRQVDGGTQIAQTPFMNYKQSSVQRAAVLTLDEHAVATGQLQEVFDGIPAMQWRIMSAETDETTLRTNLMNDIKGRLPGGIDVSVASVQNLTNSDQPLAVNFNIKGAIGTVSGKRILIPGDIFQTNSKPLLTGSKRETAVYLKYNMATVEMQQIKLPPSMTIDSVPDKQDLKYKNQVVYNYSATPSANSVLTKRVYVLGEYVFPPTEYSDARDFYNKLAQADQSVILVKQAGGNGN
jgi:hypothetical protein